TRTVFWSELQGNISREALQHFVDEVRRAELVGTDKAKCGCLLTSTMGVAVRVLTCQDD
ncbi:otubain, partial [Trifolium medium]|nr:otubain [Trifolium medium]